MATAPNPDSRRLLTQSASEFEQPRSSVDSSPFLYPRKPVPNTLHAPAYTVIATDHGFEPRHQNKDEDGDGVAGMDKRSPNVINQWWPELASCVLMLASLFAIVGVLYPRRDKPLPNWPYRITINTVIAILATILKTAALLILSEGISHLKWQWFAKHRPLRDFSRFDAASRGPWGCAKLLLAPRGMHLVASLGAALVILSLALDPFTQQLIRYKGCSPPSLTSQATLPRSNLYAEAGAHTGAGIYPPATQMLSFIDLGLYNPADVQTPFVCQTGNCRFDRQYSTLGYCATCEDLSSELKIAAWSRQDVERIGSGLQRVTDYYINTTLPSGTHTFFNGTSAQESWFVMNSTGGQGFEIVLAATALPGSNESFYDQRRTASTLRNTTTVGQGCVTQYENNTWACSGIGGSGAARCKLDPCVRTYTATIENATIQETLVAQHVDMFIGAFEYQAIWMMADVSCAGPDSRQQLQRAGFNITDQTTLIPWNVAVQKGNGTIAQIVPPYSYIPSNVTVPGPLLNTTTLPLDIIPAHCIYQLYEPTWKSLNAYLSSYLNGSLNPAANDDAVDGPGPVRAIFNDTFVNFDSINYTFNSIAESITLRIREYGYPDALPVSDPATGSVLEEQTCVEVRWGFLAFPAALTAMTITFLGLLLAQAMSESHDDTAVATGGTSTLGAASLASGWKSSPLPAVFGALAVDFRQLDQDGKATKHTGFSIRDMEGMARFTQARLNFTGPTHLSADVGSPEKRN